jgi:hypothetical protein
LSWYGIFAGGNRADKPSIYQNKSESFCRQMTKVILPAVYGQKKNEIGVSGIKKAMKTGIQVQKNGGITVGTFDVSR